MRKRVVLVGIVVATVVSTIGYMGFVSKANGSGEYVPRYEVEDENNNYIIITENQNELNDVEKEFKDEKVESTTEYLEHIPHCH